jgi:hypothetical protein
MPIISGAVISIGNVDRNPFGQYVALPGHVFRAIRTLQ